jgi:hypothetical protein
MDTWAEQGIREAKATRERLEKMSPSAGRRNFATILNAMVADAAGREMPGLVALEGIRKAQRLGRRTAADYNRTYAKFERADLSEARRLLDAAGRLASGDPRARDHWSSGEPEAIAAEWLLTAARALVAAERERQVQEAAHDTGAGRIPLAGRR